MESALLNFPFYLSWQCNEVELTMMYIYCFNCLHLHVTSHALPVAFLTANLAVDIGGLEEESALNGKVLC